MKILVLILRSLLGLVYFAFGLMFLLHLMPGPSKADVAKMPEAAVAFQTFGSVYFMLFLKIVETISGLLLLINKYTTLVLVIIFPVTLNIFLFHAFLEPQGLGIAVPLLLINLYLGYAYRKYYAPLFTTTPVVE